MNYYGYPSDTTQYRANCPSLLRSSVKSIYHTKTSGQGGGVISWRDGPPGLKIPSDDFLESEAKLMNPMRPPILQREIQVDLTAGIHLAQNIALMWSERFHQVRVDDGIIKTLPEIQEGFPTINGIDGADIWGHRLTFRYDTRDRQLISTQGTYLNVSVEWNQNFKQHAVRDSVANHRRCPPSRPAFP